MKIDDLLNDIDDNEAIERYPWCTDSLSIRKAKKEIYGEHLLDKDHVFATLYKERFTKVADLDMQKKGVDYKSFSRKVDIKVSIGDFRDDYTHTEECIPIEIYQNNKITFDNTKITTDLLFINVNLETEEVYYISVPYSLIKRIVSLNLSNDIFAHLNKLYIKDRKQSDNKSGIFIKMPIYKLVNLPNVLLIKAKL